MKGVYVGQMITRILKNLQYWPTQASRIPKDGVATSRTIAHSTFKSWGTQKNTPDPTFDVETPGSAPPTQPSTSFSVGSVAQLQAEVVEMKKKQNIMLKILTKLAEAARVDISSCFSESPPREQPPAEEPSSSEALQIMAPPEQFEPLDIEALKAGESYYSSEDEEEELPTQMEEDEEDEDDSDNSGDKEKDSDEDDSDSD